MIPIGTDNPLRSRPLINYAIILANLAIFLLTLPYVSQSASPAAISQFQTFMLQPESPRLYQFISYAFLHGGLGHILGNMLFLYIFGNNVNDRLGNIGYLLLYLGGAVFSGLGHAFFNTSAVLGASGAVAAVTGAYMVLFPRTTVHVLLIFILITTVDIPALYFISFKLVIWDNIIENRLAEHSNIAYGAHLAGYAFGIAIPMAMLALKFLPHSQFDLWALTQRFRRRQRFSRPVGKDYDPYSYSDTEAARKSVRLKVTDSEPVDAKQLQVSQIRTEISQSISQSNMVKASELYLNLLRVDSQQVLPQQQQLDIANKLMHLDNHSAAAAAYESFLSRYPKYPFLEQVQLMLGLLYSRYLNDKDQAVRHLQSARENLTEPSQIKMCTDELSRLRAGGQ